MSLFACEQCKTLENTALGWWWSRHTLGDGRALCSACAPRRYPDGTPTSFTGQWHGEFPRRQATLSDGIINEWVLGRGRKPRPPVTRDHGGEAMVTMATVALAARMAPRREPPPPVYDHPRQKSRQVQRAEERAERKQAERKQAERKQASP